jgi:CRP-like cAMP-binding protein
VNRILDALPEGERTELLGRLEPCRHKVRDSVYRQGERIESVVFPVSGVFSLVVDSEVEIATVGREGFVGLPVFLRATLTGVHMAFSQIEGDALRMDAAEFLDAVNGFPGLRTVLQRYTMALMTQIARGAACSRQHSPDARTCRWLLQTHDRVEADRFHMPPEFLAQMVGGHVDGAVTRLAAAGLISYDADEVTVLDRRGLERTSCDCYALIREEYDRLL